MLTRRKKKDFNRLFTNVLQPHEPTCRVGEVAAKVRVGGTDEIQQHKEILEEREGGGEGR